MSFVQIWAHLVFSTKKREPLPSLETKRKICAHIVKNCEEKGIHLQCVNGYLDHLHCLVSLGNDQSIAKVANLIKGESSFWVNKEELCPYTFEWQDDYFAVSVSESHLSKLVAYIKNQEVHHATNSFVDEMKSFEAKYGIVSKLK